MTGTKRPPVQAARISAAVGAALLSLALGACGATASPSSSPTAATVASVAPTLVPSLPSVAPTPSPSVAPSPSPSPSPSTVAAIPDGTWISDPIPVATVRSIIEHAHLSAADRQSLLTDVFGVTSTTKVLQEQLVLDHGSWVQLGSWDGAPMTEGSKGSYAIPNSANIAMQDNVSLITYRVSLSGTTLRLTMRADSGWTGDLADDVGPRIVFCTAAWHRQG